jgi:hypothetical protein
MLLFLKINCVFDWHIIFVYICVEGSDSCIHWVVTNYTRQGATDSTS